MKHRFLTTSLALALTAAGATAKDEKKPVIQKSESTSTSTSFTSNNGKTEGTVTVTVTKDGNTETKTWKIGGSDGKAAWPFAVQSAAPTEKASWLGIGISEVSDDLHTQLPIPRGAGIRVVSVMPGSPAQKAGLQRDDLIYKIDDQILFNTAQFQSLIRTRKPGKPITITYFRKGRQQTTQAKPILKELPALSPAPPGQPFFPGWRPGAPQPFQFKWNPDEFRKKIEERIKRAPGAKRDATRPGGKPQVRSLEKLRNQIRNDVAQALKDAGVSEKVRKETLGALDRSFKQLDAK